MKTDSQLRFFEMLNQVPRIQHLWDEQGNGGDGAFCPEEFEAELGVMASGEIQLAKFFCAVWFNDNSKYGFDIVDAVAKIDTKHRALISSWVNNPFWP